MQTETTEQKIIFPNYFKIGSIYYANMKENICIALYLETNTISMYKTFNQTGSHLEEIRQSEFLEKFNKLMGEMLTNLNKY